ncbi:MAG: hypothetical protein ACREYF_05960, partial [Gammaproteobacteria bacterium]
VNGAAGANDIFSIQRFRDIGKASHRAAKLTRAGKPPLLSRFIIEEFTELPQTCRLPSLLTSSSAE